MKYCTKCGAALEDSAKFCHVCGTPAADPPVADRNSQPSANSQTTSPSKKRWGIAAQFDAIAAGQKSRFSYYTYLYGFFQLLYHKSYRLFCRTYLPCCAAMLVDLGLLAYALNAVPAANTLSAIAFLLLLLIAIWFIVISIWMSRYYPQELYKQVQGNADRIPANPLMPILGGIALVILAIAAVLIGCTLAPAAPHSLPEAPSSGYTEPLTEEEPSPVPTEVPTESPAPSESVPELPEEEMSCLVPVAEPWKGAWCSPDGSDLFVFESTVYTVDTYQTNEDGSFTIYRADERDGTIYDVYTLSADETELTYADADGNILGTYYRPSYDMAPNPLPEECWGAYTMVEDYTISDYNPNGFTQLGPQDLFIVDAFRLGNFPYQQLTDLGDGTWSAYFAIPPEGGEYRFDFSTETDGFYMSIYSAIDGSIYARYLRIEQ